MDFAASYQMRSHGLLRPRNSRHRRRLSGWAGPRATETYWDRHAGDHASFFIAGQTAERLSEVRLWDIFTKATGFNPDLTAQPTGDCVAASASDAVECLSSVKIANGSYEEYHFNYVPYHYATGRVLIGKNQLRGGAGSVGGWQAKALEQYGVIRGDLAELPEYNEHNADAWGDGRDAEGQSFRDYLDQGSQNIVKSTARLTTMSEVFDSLSNCYPLTIASNRGYSMTPDSQGYHRPRGSWSHQMSIWGYSIAEDWIAIKNQWSDVHGNTLVLPKGFLKVHLDEFERLHLRGSETIAYSNFVGFPEQRFDFNRWV